ncbi:MAG: retroviral-like aspartic protease family protein [Turicibacter sp.]|nr:retroviral-like aspartic protease family protein [Turicibacter sp.]
MKTIRLPFFLRDTKIISEVFILNKEGEYQACELIIDCGCVMTTISPQLFEELGFEITDEAKIAIIGINSREIGVSTIIPSFKLGTEELGGVRVAVGTMRPEFQNSILLGMNVLGWFDFGWSMSNKMAVLVPRKFKDAGIFQRCFRFKNPKNRLLAVEVENDEVVDLPSGD